MLRDLLGVSLILPLILPMVKSLGASHFVAGGVTSIYGAIQLFSSPAMGRWSDIVGRRPVMLVCLVATAISYLVMGASRSLFIIILGRAIAGIFKHSQTICRALLADITSPEERSQVFGTFNAASSIGFIIGPMLGGHISEFEDGFYIVCNLGASFFLVNFVLCWLFIPDARVVQLQSPRKSESKGGSQLLALMKDVDWKIFGDIFLIRFFLSFSSLVYRSNFSLLVAQNFGASPRVIGYLISFQGIISALAGFFTGQVSRFYRDPQQELYHGSILLTLALIGLTAAPSLTLLLFCLIPLCISTAIIRVSGSAVTISRCQSSQIGSVTGFGQSIASVARMVTPLVAGMTQEMSVYGPGMIGALSAGVGAALTGNLHHNTRLKSE
ncbi:major facilitator superfamily domain-containing protein 9-like isoform X2 [Procambarus clarkii]|uniref:major facilitator superfamily domain-containing protein 9 isoform X2 n=1 Tax=Procambarus clarkii TaxID=6728 RepID=UPI001E675107|nr:major facilitator superfamily domain-containing protein 9-like isoform X2 [Procambarus clarkii]